MSHRKPRRQKAQTSFSSINSKANELASPFEQKKFLDFYNANDYTTARSYASGLTQRYPRDPFVWKVLGSCLQAMGEADKAHDALERAYQLDTRDAQICHLLAHTHKDLGNADSALDCARKVVSLDPDFAQGRFTLAQLLAESSYGGEAFEHVDQAEALGYNRIACLVLRGHLQEKGRRFAELRSTIDALLQLDPENPHIYNDLANYHKDLGQFEQAEQAYNKALEIDPQFHTAALNRIICAHYSPAYSAEDILDTIKQLQSRLMTADITVRHPNVAKELDKTLRIGMVSPGLRLHPVGQMITAALEQLTSGFELYAYSTNTPDDIITQRIRGVVTKWQTVGHLSEDQLADQIHSDRIDILIDLAGYGDGSRLKTMAQKPAPLIVKWVGGLINTMGMPAFDYLISDNIETPTGVDDMYIEKLIRLPDDYICYLPPGYAPSITALPALKNRFVTLGCFNNSAKINATVLKHWALIMQELPNSQLLLKSGQYENSDYCQYIRDTMAMHGIMPERVLLEGQSKHQELLETYNRVDIALDTWPYSGGLTTCEAFMMGVPVVSLPGPTFAGRHSATHLINTGMPELVVNSWEEYRQRVVELANDLPNLSVIRACLRRFLMQSPVCDAERFGKHFSNAMRAIWQRHCEGKFPAALNLDKDGVAQFADQAEPVQLLSIEESSKKPEIVIPKEQEALPPLPTQPHMSPEELALFDRYLSQSKQYFEYGSGGSTSLAVSKGLVVHGVESDKKWVERLTSGLGNFCQVKWGNIGPVGSWGAPIDNSHRELFPEYSKAIFVGGLPYDFILVDGRFRVACILMAIKHIVLSNNRDAFIFVHDFWNREQYHMPLMFLDHVESAISAGVFKVRDAIDMDLLEKSWHSYAYIPH